VRISFNLKKIQGDLFFHTNGNFFQHVFSIFLQTSGNKKKSIMFQYIDLYESIDADRTIPPRTKTRILKEILIKKDESRRGQRETMRRCDKRIELMEKKLLQKEQERQNAIASLAYFIAVDGQYESRDNVKEYRVVHRKIVEGRHIMMAENVITNISNLSKLIKPIRKKRRVFVHHVSETESDNNSSSSDEGDEGDEGDDDDYYEEDDDKKFFSRFGLLPLPGKDGAMIKNDEIE
jgi:hypothetical protein